MSEQPSAENDAPLCPGCDDPIPPRCQRFGVCHNCYGTTDDPFMPRPIPPGQDPSADHGVYFCDCTTDDHERPHTYAIPPDKPEVEP